MTVGDAHVFPGFLTPALTFFPNPQLHLLQAPAELRDKNTPERKFASTEYQTHKHQVMSLIYLPLSHPGKAHCLGKTNFKVAGMKEFADDKLSPAN